MTWLVLAAIMLGIILGYGFLPAHWMANLDLITTLALGIMLVGVGLDLGSRREAWRRIWKMGWKILLIPILVAAGTLVGSLLAGLLLQMPLREALAVGAGFGWYSLSGVILAKIYAVETGALAFLTNVTRETLAFVLIPLLAAKAGKLVAVAPGGATTMDTTLPLIARVTDGDTAMVALVNGMVLSALVPVLVPLLIRL